MIQIDMETDDVNVKVPIVIKLASKVLHKIHGNIVYIIHVGILTLTLRLEAGSSSYQISSVA